MKAISKIGGWIVIALAVACSVGGLVLGLRAFAKLDDLYWAGWAFVLFGWFPVIFIHELGHAIAAWSVRWRVWVFHVAPFAYWPHSSAIRFVGDLGGADTGGFVLALPRTLESGTWRRSAWFSAGGPLASWSLAGVLALTGALAFDQYNFPTDDVRRYIGDNTIAGIQQVLYAMALYSVSAALLTSWPMNLRGGHGNDASDIAALLRNRRNLRDDPNAGVVSARQLWVYGVPLAAMEPWTQRDLEQAPSPGADAERILTNVLDALCRQNEQDIRRAISEIEQRHPNSDEAKVLRGFCAVWFDAAIRDADMALSSAAHIKPNSDLYRVRQLALATIHRLEGNIEAAETVANSISASAKAFWGCYSPSWDALAFQAVRRALPKPTPVGGLPLSAPLP